MASQQTIQPGIKKKKGHFINARVQFIKTHNNPKCVFSNNTRKKMIELKREVDKFIIIAGELNISNQQNK